MSNLVTLLSPLVKVLSKDEVPLAEMRFPEDSVLF